MAYLGLWPGISYSALWPTSAEAGLNLLLLLLPTIPQDRSRAPCLGWKEVVGRPLLWGSPLRLQWALLLLISWNLQDKLLDRRYKVLHRRVLP